MPENQMPETDSPVVGEPESGSTRRIASNTIALKPLSEIEGASYNPRKASSDRLEALKDSLMRMGFLLPLYINQQGILLSGHQRAKAAAALGYTHVPVVEAAIPEALEKGINLVFNYVTNDFANGDTPQKLFGELSESLPTSWEGPCVPVDTFPCMDSHHIMPVAELLESSGVRESPQANIVTQLSLRKVFMPIVVCQGRVVNGYSRLMCYAQQGYTHVGVVEIEPDKEAYVRMVLNCLSMDFNMQEHLGDDLRFNAFRRSNVQATVVGLSRTWTYPVFGRVLLRAGASREYLKDGIYRGKQDAVEDFSLMPDINESSRRKFVKVFGHRIVDFGAGTHYDVGIMQRAGFDAIGFEPYSYPEGETFPNPEYSRGKTSEFLDWLDERRILGVDSCVSSYVLNSIPHHKDRMAFLAIIAATAKPHTTLFLTARSAMNRKTMPPGVYGLEPGLEANMVISLDSRNFKAQKMLWDWELKNMLEVFWGDVSVVKKGESLIAKCRIPRRVNPYLLSESLELEFDLPYADGSRMGLVDRAKEVYSRYKGLTLP
jgi:hypothetical protein